MTRSPLRRWLGLGSSPVIRTGTAERSYRVLGGFDASADSYDRLVAANPGYHRHLRRSARRLRLPDRGRGLRLLDAGCGTGASTAALLRAAPRAQVIGIDGSRAMLARARRKHWPETVEFVDAELDRLGEAEVHGPFDGILAAYLVRNLDDLEGGLRLLFELVKPGASVALHEYTLRPRPVPRAVWTAVCWGIIIPAGKLVTGDTGLYRYLWRSVLNFDTVEKLSSRMTEVGFANVRTYSMSGWQHGIVHTIVGTRPVEGQ